MKNILIFHTHGGIGGAGQSLLDIVRVLTKANFNVTVVCPSNPPNMIKYLSEMKVSIIEVKRPLLTLPHYNGASVGQINIGYWRSILKILFNGKMELLNIISSLNYDVVVLNSMVFVWMIKYFPSQIPVICFHRETYMKGIFGFRTKKIMRDLGKAEKIIFISEYDKKKTKYVEDGKKYVIQDSVSIDKYCKLNRIQAIEQLNLDQEDQYVLFVGGTNRIKGADVIIKAFRYIYRKNIKLLFVPWEDEKKTFKAYLNGCSRYNIEKKIKKYHLQERIIFFPSQKDMSKLYCAADIVVFPSKVAHQARPIYEAGAAHKTIIITDFVETRENLIDGYNGLVFKKNNAKQLAEKICMLLNNRALKSYLENNNFNMTLKNHDMKNFSRKILNIFEELRRE